MNKAELIEALSARAELSKAQAASAIDGLVEIITAAITKGESVALIGFDTFKSVMRVAREGRDLCRRRSRVRSGLSRKYLSARRNSLTAPWMAATAV